MTLEDLIYLRFISPGNILTLKILSAIISLLFIFGIFYFLRKTSWLRWRFTQDMKDLVAFKSYEIKKFEKVWVKIKKRLESPLESEYKLAVIEADDLLNEILKKMKYKGESLGERLNQITADIISNIGEVRKAHDAYNNIIHDPDYQTTLEQAQKFIKIYEKAFQGLNILS